MLKPGQVFESVNKLYVCLRVNECSAVVVKTTMDEINNEEHIFSEYGPTIRITANPEMDRVVCFIDPKRIKNRIVSKSEFKPREVGVVYVPIPGRIQKTDKPRKLSRPAVSNTAAFSELVSIFEISSRVAAGLIKG